MKKTWMMVALMVIGLGLVSCKDKKESVFNGCVCTLTDEETGDIEQQIVTLEDLNASGISDCATLEVTTQWADYLEVSCVQR